MFDVTEIVAAADTGWMARHYPDVLCGDFVPGVYVFAAGPYVKVGWSKMVWIRAEQLAKGHGKEHRRPADLPRKTGGDIIAAWPGTRADEKAAHVELTEHNVIGEWFHRNADVDAWIERKVAEARAAS
jgi:hypothetical protein